MKLYKVYPLGALGVTAKVKSVLVCAANKVDAKRLAERYFPRSYFITAEKVTKEQIIKIDYVRMEDKES